MAMRNLLVRQNHETFLWINFFLSDAIGPKNKRLEELKACITLYSALNGL
jgi:hypothetical protein